MDKPPRGWLRHPAMLGLTSGFLVGTLSWVGLIIALGPSVTMTSEDGQLVERPNPIAGVLIFAPVVAVPWAIVGMIVGTVSNFTRGYRVPVLAALGTIVGLVYSLHTNPFDGWLALEMPKDCLLGTMVGMGIGVVCAIVQTLVASSRKGTPPQLS